MPSTTLSVIGGDGLLGDVGPVDLGKVGLDLAGRQGPRGRRNHHLVDAGQTLLRLTHDLRLEGAVPVAGTDISTGPTLVSTVLPRVPLRELPLFMPAESCLS
jgi:hypothetical protein